MVAAFDSVGPSGSGVGQSATPTTWTHTTVAASTTVIVAAALDGVAPGATASCTLGGTTMTQLGSDVPSGTGGTTGIVRVWSMDGVAAGAHTIVVSCASQNDLTGGSIAFSGKTGLGTVATNAGSATGSQYSINVPSSTSGNTIVAFVGAGNSITGTNTPATSQFVNNFLGSGGAACGDAAGATSPAGGSVTVVWTGTSTVAATFAVEVQGANAPVITTSSLPDGTVGAPYSQAVAATGGTTPYSWAVTSGSLPAGLSLGSSTGIISGTPTTAGSSTFTVQVTDNASLTASASLTIVVDPALPGLSLASAVPGLAVPGAFSPEVLVSSGIAEALSESGTGTDTLAITATVALAESGQGTDTLAVTALAALTEAGTGADALGIAALVALAETGTGTDTLGIMPGLAEAGTGTDTLGVAAQVALAEAGSGTDALGVAVPTGLTEAGTGSDSLGIMPGLSETGTGSDTLSVVIASPVPLTDAGTGSDALGITQPTALAEAGTGADALSLTQPTALAEAGTGADTLGIAVPVALAEAGTGTDVLAIATPEPLAETGTGTDALAVTAQVALPEAGTGTDALAVTAAVTLAEAGTGTDALGITALVALPEAGAGTDALGIAIAVALTETGTGTDVLSAGPGTVKTDTDSCTASESEFAFVVSAEAGTAAEAGETIVVQDTDLCSAAERELTAWPHDTDACAAAEAGWQSGLRAGGTDTCSAAEHGELITLASSDACAADDEAPDIEIYTYVPPFRTGPGGGWYKVAWGEREVLRTTRVDGAVLRFARELNRARELRFVSDDDVCSAAESDRRVTGVVVSVVPALEVSVQVGPITRDVEAGQSIVVRVTAARDGKPVTDGPVTAEFWPPGADPQHDPPAHEAPCFYDERTRRWLARVSTAGWVPGRWTVRGAVRADEAGWAWSTFPLSA